MKLNSGAVTGSYEQVVQSKFMKFLFVINCGVSGTAFNATQALTAVRNTTLELEKINKSGTSTPLRKMSLLNYLEIGSALSHGPVNVTTTGDVTVVEGDVIVGVDGDINPAAGEEYRIKIAGLAANCSMDVYILPIKKDATLIFDYNKTKTYADVASKVDVSAAHLLCMPKADIEKLELEAPDGTRIEFLAPELKQHLNDFNAQAFNINGLVTPVGLDLYAFPVSAATNALFTATADKNLIVVNAQRV